MCRLAMWNSDYMSLLSENQLKKFLTDLEDEFGGNGNGYAVRTRQGAIRGDKGVKLSTKTIAHTLKDWQAAGAREFLFHTRIASIGKPCDALCHPFIWSRSALAHNGHDVRFAPLGSDSVFSDTMLIALLLKNKMMLTEHLADCRGAFVGWQNGRPFAYASPTSDLMVALDGNAWMLASTIGKDAAQGEVYDSIGYAWDGDGPPPIPEKYTTRPRTRFWESIGTTGYGAYYDEDDAAVHTAYLDAEGHLCNTYGERLTEDEVLEYWEASGYSTQEEDQYTSWDTVR